MEWNKSLYSDKDALDMWGGEKKCKLKSNIHHPIPFKNVFNINIFISLSGRIYPDDYQWLPQGGWETLSVMFTFLWARITLAKEGAGGVELLPQDEKNEKRLETFFILFLGRRVLCTSTASVSQIQAIRARVSMNQNAVGTQGAWSPKSALGLSPYSLSMLPLPWCNYSHGSHPAHFPFLCAKHVTGHSKTWLCGLHCLYCPSAPQKPIHVSFLEGSAIP